MKKFNAILILASIFIVSSCALEQGIEPNNPYYSIVKPGSKNSGNEAEKSMQTEESVSEIDPSGKDHKVINNSHYHCHCCEGECCCGTCLGTCCGKAFCCIGLLIIIAAGVFFVINWKTDLVSIPAINPNNW